MSGLHIISPELLDKWHSTPKASVEHTSFLALEEAIKKELKWSPNRGTIKKLLEGEPALQSKAEHVARYLCLVLKHPYHPDYVVPVDGRPIIPADDSQAKPRSRKALWIFGGLAAAVIALAFFVRSNQASRTEEAQLRGLIDEAGIYILLHPEAMVLPEEMTAKFAALEKDTDNLAGQYAEAAVGRDRKKADKLYRQLTASRRLSDDVQAILSDIPGLMEAREGHWKEAERVFSLALAKNPDDKLAHLGTFAARFQLPEVGPTKAILEARPYWSKLRSEEAGMPTPFYWVATNNLGFSYAIEGNPKMSLVYLEEFVGKSAKGIPAYIEASALHNLARSYVDLGDSRAMETQKKAIALFAKLGPSDEKMNALAFLGSLKEDARDYAGAEDDITTAILQAKGLHPESYLLGQFYIMRASVRIRLKGWIAGKEDADEGLRLVPARSAEAAAGHLYRAECLVNLNMPNHRAKASEDIQAAMNLSANDKESLAIVKSTAKRLNL